jgi:S1-C subfamily serine protease
MRRLIGFVAVLTMLLSTTASAQDFKDSLNNTVFKKVRPTVVGVRCQTAMTGIQVGTGVVLNKEGLVLTSTAVVAPNPPLLQIFLEGPVIVKADYVGGSKDDELALVQIRMDTLPEGYELTPIEFGNSADVEIGQTVFTFGNCTFSIIFDDRVVMNTGIISGVYDLEETRHETHYLGRAFETTAAIIPATTDGKGQGMSGGPLVNTRGEMIAMNIMNHSKQRWLSNAIPIDYLKGVIEDIQEQAAMLNETGNGAEDGPAGPGWIGITFDPAASKPGHLVVKSVTPGSPADDEGIMEGDVIVALGENDVESVDAFNAFVRGISPGGEINLVVLVDGEEMDARFAVARDPNAPEETPEDTPEQEEQK